MNSKKASRETGGGETEWEESGSRSPGEGEEAGAEEGERKRQVVSEMGRGRSVRRAKNRSSPSSTACASVYLC